MIQTWKKSLHNGKTFTALLTNLSKAFDCLPHKLILGKLNAYGLSLTSLKLMHSYSLNRKQRTRINSVYNSWGEILFDLPQGSNIGLLVLNIFIWDLFSILGNIGFTNYGDNTTRSVAGDGSKEVIDFS